MELHARHFKFVFPRPALIMGVINITPDSFYDGGKFLNSKEAIEQALRLAAEGAEILDIGGESSRPGATPVEEVEELERVLPVIEELRGKISIPISVDTTKPAVARFAIQAGAAIINDVAANRIEEEMWNLAAETGAGYVAMHMQGTPQTMQQNPHYDDVVMEINAFFADRLNRLRQCGVRKEQVMLDVGIGFGKRAQDNLELLAHMRQFTKWDRPILMGASKKSFLGRDLTLDERLSPSIAAACWAVEHGANIIRCHDVAATKAAIRLTESLMQ